MNAWDKLQLGWLNYASVSPGEHKKFTLTLGPAEYNSNNPQAVVVNLPDKRVTSQDRIAVRGLEVLLLGHERRPRQHDDEVGRPSGRCEADREGPVQHRAGLGLRVPPGLDGRRHDVDERPDEPVDDDRSNGQNFGQGITGLSTGGSWVDLTADLAAYGGKTVLLQFRYWTDGAQQGNPGAAIQPGISLDEIAVTGQAVDGAEASAGWTFVPATGGFRATTGTEENSYYNAYIAENRQYLGFDESLRTGPYQFGFLDQPDKQDLVEHFPYQDGLLIWYWDTSQADNNVGDHPGSGLILPIDSHPEMLHWSDGTLMRPRLQSFDSPFSTKNTDKITLHKSSVATTIPKRHGVDTFDDTQSYWVPSDPADGTYKASWSSVKVPGDRDEDHGRQADQERERLGDGVSRGRRAQRSGRTTEGRGRPRPSSSLRFSVDRRRDAGAARNRDDRTASEPTHGANGEGLSARRRTRAKVAPNLPVVVARTTSLRGPVSVSAVTTMRSPGWKESPLTTSGWWPMSRSFGPFAAPTAGTATRITMQPTTAAKSVLLITRG